MVVSNHLPQKLQFNFALNRYLGYRTAAMETSTKSVKKERLFLQLKPLTKTEKNDGHTLGLKLYNQNMGEDTMRKLWSQVLVANGESMWDQRMYL